MADVGDPTQNGHVERLIRTIEDEQVDFTKCGNYQDAYNHIKRFLEDVFMFRRIHSSLGYLTPVEFEREWMTRKPWLFIYKNRSFRVQLNVWIAVWCSEKSQVKMRII